VCTDAIHPLPRALIRVPNRQVDPPRRRPAHSANTTRTGSGWPDGRRRTILPAPPRDCAASGQSNAVSSALRTPIHRRSSHPSHPFLST
jgi:hypothetical protein